MPFLTIVAGILLSAFAQLGLKRIADFAPWSKAWLWGMVGCVFLYGLAFLAYSYILRNCKITVAGPLMTVGVVGVVVMGGLLMGEALSARQWGGIALSIIVVWLLLS